MEDKEIKKIAGLLKEELKRENFQTLHVADIKSSFQPQLAIDCPPVQKCPDCPPVAILCKHISECWHGFQDPQCPYDPIPIKSEFIKRLRDLQEEINVKYEGLLKEFKIK